MYLAAKENKQNWYLDSDCPRYMTSDKDQFVTLETKERGVMTFGDNGKGHIVGIDKIQLTPLIFLENVFSC